MYARSKFLQWYVISIFCLILTQSFLLIFSGIGNYLRAEILHRACVDPFIPARDVFNKTSLLYRNNPTEFERSYLALDHLTITDSTDKGFTLLILYSFDGVRNLFSRNGYILSL